MPSPILQLIWETAWKETSASRTFPKSTAGRLIAACKQVQNRAMTDDVITNAIAEAFVPDYLSGASSLEATVFQKIDAATNTYLAE